MSVIKVHDLDEVATKRDLAELKSELVSEIAALKQTTANWMLTVLVTVVGAMVGLAFLA